jgi:hypothetical protein
MLRESDNGCDLMYFLFGNILKKNYLFFKKNILNITTSKQYENIKI